MSLEKEIRIAKLQIMWTVAVATLGLWWAIPYGENVWVFLAFPLFLAIWYIGNLSIRKEFEQEKNTT